MARKSKVDLSDDFAAYVRQRYTIAHAHKTTSGVYNRLLECHQAWRGEDLENPEGLETDESAPVRLVLNVARPLIRGVTALMQRPLSGVKDKPWTIRASPIVELSRKTQEKVANQIARDMPQIVEAAGADPEKVDTIITKVAETQRIEDQKQGMTAADKLSIKIADQLHDAGFTSSFQDFLHNLSLYPIAILKTEDAMVRRLEWNGNTLEPVDDTVRAVVNISPFDFYPAPGARGVQDCEYLIERRRVGMDDFAKLSGVPGYDTAAILRVLEHYPTGHEEPVSSSTSQAGQDTQATTMFYDMLAFYGKIPGKMLKQWGISVSNEALPYEAEVWIVGEVCVKALVNPDPLGRRPYFSTAFEPLPAEIYGESPGTDIIAVQRLITATASALVRNLAYSSGPIGEVEADRVADDEDPRLIAPGTMRVVKKDRQHGSPAYKFHTVPSLTNELMKLLQEFQEYAYVVLGIPRIAFGGPQGLGTVGRTSGGVAALLNQSSNTMYHALESVEQNVIQPLVQSFIDREMMFGTDMSVKGDLRAYAVGVSGLAQKESQGDKLQWALQSLGPLMQIVDPNTKKPIISPEAPARLLYQMFKDIGVPTEGIFPDFDKMEAVAIDSGGKLGSLSGAPTLDGRSGNMQQALNTQNEAVPASPM